MPCMMAACVQSCPELRAEAVDYFQQDAHGFAGGQAAETLCLAVDVTADGDTLQALQTLITQVRRFCEYDSPSGH